MFKEPSCLAGALATLWSEAASAKTTFLDRGEGMSVESNLDMLDGRQLT